MKEEKKVREQRRTRREAWRKKEKVLFCGSNLGSNVSLVLFLFY